MAPPVSATPMSGAPVTAVPYPGAPMPAAAPAAWYPQAVPAAPQPEPKRRGRAGVILLSISTVLLLITTLAATGLLLWKFDEADKLTKQTHQQTAAIDAKSKELDTLRKDADDALREKGEQTSRADDAEKRADTVAKCLNAIYDMYDALDEGNESKITKQGKVVDKACKAADKYL
jgi:hypothetical protein